MLRHMCPPLGLGKRCPARVAYKVRKDPIFTRVSCGCRGVEGGDLSAQHGVNFSVAVSFVLFHFLFHGKGRWDGWCCGIV